jgi:uncharacterized protein YqgQ
MTDEEFILKRKCIIKDNDVLFKTLDNEIVSIFDTYLIDKKNFKNNKTIMFKEAVTLLKITQNITRLNYINNSKDKDEFFKKNVPDTEHQ